MANSPARLSVGATLVDDHVPAFLSYPAGTAGMTEIAFRLYRVVIFVGRYETDPVVGAFVCGLLVFIELMNSYARIKFCGTWDAVGCFACPAET